MTTVATITCPYCGCTSAHPQDIAERFCGFCKAWTSVIPDGHTGPLRISDDSPGLDGYLYGPTGAGVRQDIVAVMLNAWASMSPHSRPETTLRSVGQGSLNSAQNIARVAAQAVLEYLANTTGELRSAER